MARPIATRWRWPPESCARLAVEQRAEPEDLGGAVDLARAISAFGVPRELAGAKAMFSHTVMCG